MTYKFELGQLVTHIAAPQTWVLSPTTYLILGRGHIETLGGVDELYMVGYSNTEHHFCKQFVYVQELQALKTEENEG